MLIFCKTDKTFPRKKLLFPQVFALKKLAGCGDKILFIGLCESNQLVGQTFLCPQHTHVCTEIRICVYVGMLVFFLPVRFAGICYPFKTSQMLKKSDFWVTLMKCHLCFTFSMELEIS